MNTSSSILRRRMIRQYTEKFITPETIELLLEAATHAPSPHHRQPWRFAVITGEAIYALARAMGDQLKSDLSHDGVSSSTIERDTSRSFRRITSAPVAFVACMSMRDMDVYPDERRNDFERWMAGQAVAAAIENILVRATELDIGACWMCAPLFCQSVVQQLLHLPEDWEPQALITLGYPADQGKVRQRMPIKDISVEISAI